MANEVKLDTIRHLNDHYGFEHLNPMIAVGHYNGELEPRNESNRWITA